MAKSLFNFYLDDDMKRDAVQKLNRLYPDEPKGLLASYLRMCVETLVEMNDDEIPADMIAGIKTQFIDNNARRSQL